MFIQKLLSSFALESSNDQVSQGSTVYSLGFSSDFLKLKLAWRWIGSSQEANNCTFGSYTFPVSFFVQAVAS